MFYLAPHPKLDRPRRGSPLMFTVPWVEKYLSRVRPWHVIAIWVPISLYMLYRGSYQMGPLAVAGLAAAGGFSWPLLEYLLPRWGFHFQPGRRSGPCCSESVPRRRTGVPGAEEARLEGGA